MKRKLYLLVITTLVFSSISTAAFAEKSLDDVINSNQTTIEQTETNSSSTSGGTTRSSKNSDFISGLNEASDITADLQGGNELTSGIKMVAGKILQVVFNALPVLLVLRVGIDLMYMTLSFTRGFLGNGHTGAASSPQQSGGGMGLGGMGMGMSSMGMGMGSGMGGMHGGSNQQGQQGAKIQWVSTAALNAVAGEKTMGPDGKPVGIFKGYIKDMVVVFIMVPILILLASTGVLTSIGLTLGSLLVDGIRNIKGMI